MIIFNKVSKSFDGHSNAVDRLSIEIIKGEVLIILGSSGSGKSTILKMINRLIHPTAGDIYFGGRNIIDIDPIEIRRSIGYVIQGIGLFPHMTIKDNISIVPRLLGWANSRIEERCREVLEWVNLPIEYYIDKYPSELSGGQQQRVGVARALAANPNCMLMDEPFGALDAITRDGLQQEMISLQRRLRKTVVFVTHDIFEALAIGDRIAVMHKGRLEQIGTKQQIIANPYSEFVKNLFSKPAKQLAVYKNIFNA